MRDLHGNGLAGGMPSAFTRATPDGPAPRWPGPSDASATRVNPRLQSVSKSSRGGRDDAPARVAGLGCGGIVLRTRRGERVRCVGTLPLLVRACNRATRAAQPRHPTATAETAETVEAEGAECAGGPAADLRIANQGAPVPARRARSALRSSPSRSALRPTQPPLNRAALERVGVTTALDVAVRFEPPQRVTY